MNKIKKWWKYQTKAKQEMYDIMDRARIKATFSHKDASDYVISTLHSRPDLLEHKKIYKVYRNFVTVWRSN